MSLFVDASALVAIIAREPERDTFVNRIDAEGSALWSPMSSWETVSALTHSYDHTVEMARSRTEQTAALLGLRLVSIGADELRFALDAHEVFGKGRHRAKLNMGDCFAYACAKANNARLLYKGDDFTKTDLG